MNGNRPPEVGDWFTTATPGIAGRLIRFGTHSPVNHAGIYIGNGLAVEAQPGGARVCQITNYPNAYWSHIPLLYRERRGIAETAENLTGTPYGWPDITALTLDYFGFESKWINQRIERGDRLICSQLVDRAYLMNGVHLFNDGRLSGEVTPGDLYNLSH